MKHAVVRLSQEANTDLEDLYSCILLQSKSKAIADAYLGRLERFLGRLDLFPERGTIRNDLRPGLRVIGFERSLAIAFVVEEATVIILRIFMAGRDPFRDDALKSG